MMSRLTGASAPCPTSPQGGHFATDVAHFIAGCVSYKARSMRRRLPRSGMAQTRLWGA